MRDEGKQYDDVCKPILDEMRATLRLIDTAIRGNGEPGIKTRLDRLERFDRVWAKLTWLVVGAGVVMLVTHFFG